MRYPHRHWPLISVLCDELPVLFKYGMSIGVHFYAVNRRILLRMSKRSYLPLWECGKPEGFSKEMW